MGADKPGNDSALSAEAQGPQMVSSRAINFRINMTNAPVAQLDRASAFEAEGRGFESLRARHFHLCVRPLKGKMK